MPARAEKYFKEKAPVATAKDAEQAMEQATELENDLAALKAAFDQYFQGNERFPPSKRHESFKKALIRLKSSNIRQTAVKFRLESITQKLQTLERLWDRTIKEIEAGTYKRDLARLRRRGGRQEEKRDGADTAFDVDEDLDMSDLDEGADDLASAIAAAEAAVSAPAVKPVAPVTPVPPVAPATLKLTPPEKPAPPPTVPLTPPVGNKPATGVAPALKPIITPAAPMPVVKPGVAPAIAPTVAGPKPATGVAPAFKPGEAATVKMGTGVTAALKPDARPTVPMTPPQPRASTGVATVHKPGTPSAPGSPGTQVVAAFSPTGNNAAHRPASSPPVGRPSATAAEGLSDTKIKAIYDAYVMAKKRCGEDTRALTLDSVATSLKKQVPELMKTHKAKSVEFKVVIKDGKAVLRALPKDE